MGKRIHFLTFYICCVTSYKSRQYVSVTSMSYASYGVIVMGGLGDREGFIQRQVQAVCQCNQRSYATCGVIVMAGPSDREGLYIPIYHTIHSFNNGECHSIWFSKVSQGLYNDKSRLYVSVTSVVMLPVE